MAKRASRIETEARLIEAVGAVLADHGFTGVGVNAICARAGVNKALLYRYFGSLDGLLRGYAESGDFWPSVDEVTGPAGDFAALSPAERVQRFVPAYVAALQKRPRTSSPTQTRSGGCRCWSRWCSPCSRTTTPPPARPGEGVGSGRGSPQPWMPRRRKRRRLTPWPRS